MTSELSPTAGAERSPAQTAWVNAVINNRHVVRAVFDDIRASDHTLKIWRLDGNVVLEEIILGASAG